MATDVLPIRCRGGRARLKERAWPQMGSKVTPYAPVWGTDKTTLMDSTLITGLLASRFGESGLLHEIQACTGKSVK